MVIQSIYYDLQSMYRWARLSKFAPRTFSVLTLRSAWSQVKSGDNNNSHRLDTKSSLSLYSFYVKLCFISSRVNRSVYLSQNKEQFKLFQTWPKNRHSSFLTKSTFFKIAQKVFKYFGKYRQKTNSQELSKITKSRYTGGRIEWAAVVGKTIENVGHKFRSLKKLT